MKVSEGLVISADSVLVLEGELKRSDEPVEKGIQKVCNSAMKIKQIRDWPVGVVSFGTGQLASRTINS